MKNKNRLLFLTKYTRNGANSRYRSYQYFPYLQNAGYSIEAIPLFDDIYLKNIYLNKRHYVNDIIRCYFRRIIKLFSLKRFDLVVIEAELFPYIPPFFEYFLILNKIPYVLDYDDAIFHHYDKNFVAKLFLGRKIPYIAKHAKAIVVGNNYLANYFKKYNQNVFLIPTVIDLKKYPDKKLPLPKPFTIVWIGSPYTEDYLVEIYDAFLRFSKNYDFRLLLIGASHNIKRKLKNLPIEIVKWSEETEVRSLQKGNVGIMPLPDNKWSKGKCGLKLIQYMGCFLPVIASPIGVNNEIVINKLNGYLAYSNEDWYNAFIKIFDDKHLQIKMGHEGRKIVEKKYSIQIIHEKYLNLLDFLLK